VFLSPIARPLLGRHAEALQSLLDDDAAYDRLSHQLEPGEQP
jgi:hypothetical protein